MIQGILFDLDNTLIQTEPVAEQALVTVLRREGISLSEDERRWMIGRRWDDIFPRVFSHRCFKMTSTALIEEVLATKDRLLLEHLPVLPGAIQAVNALRAHFPLGVVSGSFRSEIKSVLNLMKLTEYFSFIVGSEDVVRGKPDPEPYLTGVKKLDLRSYEVLVFEDSKPGIESAVTAGCFCIGCLAGGASREDLKLAHGIIETLEGVDPDWVRNIERDFNMVHFKDF